MSGLTPGGRFVEAGEAAIVTYLSMPGQMLAEASASVPFDMLVLDMQHGALTHQDVNVMLPSIIARGITPIVRVPSPTSELIGPVLDAGALGIIGPQIDTPEVAAEFVSLCHYPPRGVRSYGPLRASILHESEDYLESARDRVLAIGIIESSLAMSNLEAIMATPGLDAVLVGTSDLSLSERGEPVRLKAGSNSYSDQRVRDSVQRVAESAHAAGVGVGMVAFHDDDYPFVMSMDPQIIVLPPDLMLYQRAAHDALERARSAVHHNHAGRRK